MKIIKITRGLEILVDDEDYERVIQHSWYCVPKPCTNYAATSISKRTVQLHRFILNAPSDKWVDHIDGDGLNNQKSNLRLCTPHGNNRSRKKLMANKFSRFKGVKNSYNPRRPYRAYICVNYTRISLGHYESEIEAAKAYNTAAVHYFGEFAAINEFEE